jgi:protein associated with RNAse G/E
VEIQITEKSNKETTTKRPAMPYAQDHKQNCLKQIQSIENYFKKYSTINNHNYLLNVLDSLEDIGITIATGLIWSNNRKYRVPFDK